MKGLLSRLRGSRGQSLVELALILPLLVLLFMGVVDVSRAINAHNTIVNMAREGANLASRSMLMQEENGAQMVMNSLANTERQLDMKHKGMMHVIKVENRSGSAAITGHYRWQQNPSGPESTVTVTTLGKVLGGITLKPDDTLWIFEVFYSHESLFGGELSSSAVPQLHALALL